MRFSKDRWLAILVISPSIALIAIFVYGFIGQTIFWSLSDWKGLSATPVINFIGLKNFENLFTGILNYRFRIDLVNTVFFTIVFLSVCLALGLLLAILIDQKIRGESIFRTIFLFPMALSFVVTGTVWRWLFAPSSGLNTLPTVIGLPPMATAWFTDHTKVMAFTGLDLSRMIGLTVTVVLLTFAFINWLQNRRRLAVAAGIIGLSLAGALLSALLFPDPNLKPSTEVFGLNVAIISIVIAATWQMSGYTMAIYLAGLRGIPDELREAARVDGCTEMQIYQYIVLPLLQPITLSAVIILGHISLKIFDLIYVMAGDVNLQVDVPGINMYLTSFRGNNFSLGSSIAVIMLLLIAVIIVPYLVNMFRVQGNK
jgi:glucose/mannose transport system permease protein